ncbi:hypothetical protein [Sediminispirochaeta smaragdinae]|uniref:hypothetical protein n=1 Tax=Sediminispirochaeta smaragdinae TaxID=55206 RepID=UPI001FDFEC19|nr:hypothetical protein [Sediminispirochaeta smaragdinae]
MTSLFLIRRAISTPCWGSVDQGIVVYRRLFLLALLVSSVRVFAFGPPSFVKSGRFLSNAVGIPLSPLIRQAGEGEYWLEVKEDDGGSIERLYQGKLLIAERTIRKSDLSDGTLLIEEKRGDQTMYKAEIGDEGVLYEWRKGVEFRYGYESDDPHSVDLPSQLNGRDYYYGPEGALCAVDGKGYYLLLLPDGISYEEQGKDATAFFVPPKASFERSLGWDSKGILREERREVLSDGWQRVRLTDKKGNEEIRLYDEQSRLRDIRRRGSDGYEHFEYLYPSHSDETIRLRSAMVREESRYHFAAEGNFTAVETLRSGSLVQIIKKEGEAFVVTRFRGGDELFTEHVGFFELHRYTEDFRTLLQDYIRKGYGTR